MKFNFQLKTLDKTGIRCSPVWNFSLFIIHEYFTFVFLFEFCLQHVTDLIRRLIELVSWQMLEEGDDLTEKELDVITTVFRSYETGLREATINPKDLLSAMKMLGLNPMEQEIVDLTNNIVRNGYIYFPEFCKERFRNHLIQN